MIIFAGYENFVSKLHVADESEDKPIWMGRVDFSEMKLKLVASIVTISGINLLAAFMDLTQISDREIFWMIIVTQVRRTALVSVLSVDLKSVLPRHLSVLTYLAQIL